MISKASKYLFKHYRRKTCKPTELILTDDSHPYWAVAKGQEMCSSRTVYNIEKASNRTEEAVFEFLVKKMGYEYLSDRQIIQYYSSIGKNLCLALQASDYQKMEYIRKTNQINTLEKYFLGNVYAQLLNCFFAFYLDNNLQPYTIFFKEKYADEIFIASLYEVKKYLDMYYFLLVLNDNNKAYQYIKKLHLNELDMLIVFLVFIDNEESSIIMSLAFIDKIKDMDNGVKKHYVMILEIIADGYYLLKNKDHLTTELTGYNTLIEQATYQLMLEKNKGRNEIFRKNNNKTVFANILLLYRQFKETKSYRDFFHIIEIILNKNGWF